MNTTYTFKIYDSVATLPQAWNAIADDNIFLKTDYLSALETSKPHNMNCFFVGLFVHEKLEGIIISQFFDGSNMDSFGDRDRCLKTYVRNFVFKNFSSRVLFIGNAMLTGQNAFVFSDRIDTKIATNMLDEVQKKLVRKIDALGKKVHLVSLKDFSQSDAVQFDAKIYKRYYKFSIQPNMIFYMDYDWKTEIDYVNALSKKYRDQFKRARKKCKGLEKRKLDLHEIIDYEKTIYNLYFHVAKNAPFNTFYLAANHFSSLKKYLKDDFLFYGYFHDNKLLGFNTLIKNGTIMETYFLGYDEIVQKDKMLYLNMLYDMIAYSIKKGFKNIVFARTALEIKSSVGAKPEQLFGYLKHNNPILNFFLKYVFNLVEPKVHWNERNPFKL